MRKFTKPGPAMDGVAASPVTSSAATSASATSRGFLPRRLARLIATFAWKSPKRGSCVGRISGSTSACSTPHARTIASRMRSAIIWSRRAMSGAWSGQGAPASSGRFLDGLRRRSQGARRKPCLPVKGGAATLVCRAMGEAQQTQSLEQMLLEQGRVSTEDLRKVRRLQQERGERLERLLLDLGFISEEDLQPLLARYLGVPAIT